MVPMTEMVQIRSVKQYFNDFVVKGLEGKEKVNQVDLIPIKNAILDAFRKEIFGQIIFKLGPEAATMSKDEMANIDFVNNILVQTFRKWRRLCILCSEYGLGGFFQLEDLQHALDDESEIEEDPEEVVEIPDIEEDVTDQLEEEPVYLNGGVTVENDIKNE